MAGVTVTNDSNIADADAVTTVFNFTFFVYDASTIKVYSVLDDVLTPITTGITKAINSSFIGGTVTFDTAPADAVGDILIRREVPYTQGTELAELTRYKEIAIEQALNTLVLQNQQLASQVARCLKYTEASGVTDPTIEAPVADQFLGYADDTGRVAQASANDLADLGAIFVGLAVGHYMRYNGTNWTNIAKSTMLTDLGISAFIQTVLDDATGAAALTTLGALALAGGTMTGKLNTFTSAAVAGAGFNLPHGVVANTPVNGDLHTTTLGLFARINGATLKVADSSTGLVTLGIDTFTSSDQTVTAAGLLTLAHGLGRVPTELFLKLVNVTTEGNWVTNDATFLNPASDYEANTGCACYADATNVYVRYGSDGGVFGIKNKTTGAGTGLTPGKLATKSEGEMTEEAEEIVSVELVDVPTPTSELPTKFYVDPQGNYLGGFSEGNPSIPADAVEIPEPPAHGWQKFDLGAQEFLPLTDEQKAAAGQALPTKQELLSKIDALKAQVEAVKD